MIVDSSAILAVIGKEPGYEHIVHQLAASSATRIGAPAQLETGIVLMARFGPRGKTALARFLQENSIETVAFDEARASVALDAYSRFGKGRHPAALNFGDCCTYAVASVAGERLLCLGDDFAQTDLLLVSLDTTQTSTDTEHRDICLSGVTGLSSAVSAGPGRPGQVLRPAAALPVVLLLHRKHSGIRGTLLPGSRRGVKPRFHHART